MDANITPQDQNKEMPRRITPGIGLPLGFSALVIIALIVHIATDLHWLRISAYHLGGLGITGLFTFLTAFLAAKTGYNFRKVFLLCFFLPIILGFIAVIVVSFQTGTLYCGGGVVLAVSIILLIVYLIMYIVHITGQKNRS